MTTSTSRAVDELYENAGLSLPERRLLHTLPGMPLASASDGAMHAGAIAPPGRPVVVRPDDIAEADLPLREKILVVLAQQLWASGANLAVRLRVLESDINEACRDLEEEGQIAGRYIGVTRRKTRRYVLARLGVRHVTKGFQYQGLLRAALPLTWQMSEEGVRKMSLCMPAVEWVNEILPAFWTSGLAEPFRLQSFHADPSCTSRVWLGEPTLADVLWLPRGRLHVVTIWRFDRYDMPSRYVPIPILWSGLLPQEDFKGRSLRLGSEFIRSEQRPGDRNFWQIEPPVGVIGVDQFAAYRAMTAYGDDVSVGAVDTTGTVVWSGVASHRGWTLLSRPPARTIGHPERAATEEGPDLVNLGGIRGYRIVHFLAQFRAGTKSNLTLAFRMSRGAVNAVVEHLTERGLVTSVGKHLYLSLKAVEMLASLYRIDGKRLVEVTYLDPEGEEAATERRHDSAVASAAAAFLNKGIPAVAGWRWVVSWDGGQLVPDLWVQVPVPGRSEGIWVPVEVEFSAKGEKRIDREKLRSYRLAPADIHKTFPLLVITGETRAAKLFDRLARDLPMLTTTMKEGLTGVWEGPDSVWRRNGRTVGLSDIAREHQAHLWQRTGMSLDCSKPSPEVWSRFMKMESIWLDPQGEGLYGVSPTIDPELQAALDIALNEPKTDPSKETPSAPAPATPPAAPDRRTNRAEERARRQRELLSEIHLLMPIADDVAARKLRTEVLSDVERLCVIRVRTIIRYGASLHNRDEDGHVEELLKRCIIVREDHLGVMKSRGLLWRFTVPEHEVHPGEQFKHLLGFYNRRHGKDDARKAFEQWHRAVEAAARAARRARTVE